MTALRSMITRLKGFETNTMAPGQLPKKYFIICLDQENDSMGNELPVIELGGVHRKPDENEDCFKNRALAEYCAGMPNGTVPYLIAQRQKALDANTNQN